MPGERRASCGAHELDLAIGDALAFSAGADELQRNPR
jgi:hypothetical protein